jgi:hypothetical protein
MTYRPIIGFDVDSNGGPAIVVVVQRDGSHVVEVDGVCKSLAAEFLRGIASRLVAEHGPGLCTPAPALRHPADDEPANVHGGRLDRERKVWRDPRGEVFDLSLTWVDQTESAWRWHGSTGQFGEPILRCEDGEVQPLGVLRALYGPLAPVSGGAA